MRAVLLCSFRGVHRGARVLLTRVLKATVRRDDSA